MQNKIRPLYAQLQGFLKGLLGLDQRMEFKDKGTCDCYHKCLDELKELTGNSYDDFKLEYKYRSNNYSNSPFYVSSESFKMKLSGVISRIYGEYFYTESNPLDGSPATLITNSQNQSQTLQLEIVLEISALIGKKIDTLEEGSREKKFFEQIKSGLTTSKGVVGLIKDILLTGQNLGISIGEILKLFS